MLWTLISQKTFHWVCLFLHTSPFFPLNQRNFGGCCLFIHFEAEGICTGTQLRDDFTNSGLFNAGPHHFLCEAAWEHISVFTHRWGSSISTTWISKNLSLISSSRLARSLSSRQDCWDWACFRRKTIMRKESKRWLEPCLQWTGCYCRARHASGGRDKHFCEHLIGWTYE